MGIFTCTTYEYGIVFAQNCFIYLQIFPQFLNIIGKMVRTLKLGRIWILLKTVTKMQFSTLCPFAFRGEKRRPKNTQEMIGRTYVWFTSIILNIDAFLEKDLVFYARKEILSLLFFPCKYFLFIPRVQSREKMISSYIGANWTW